MAVQATEKRLWRSRKDAFAGGVCAGIAEYFDVDAIVVRISAVLLAFLTLGVAVIVYLVLWARIPYEPEAPAPYDVLPEHAESSAFGRVDCLQSLASGECDEQGSSLPLVARLAVAAGLMLLFLAVSMNISPLMPGTQWWQFWPLMFLMLGLCLIIIPIRTRFETMWHAGGIVLTSLSASLLPMTLGMMSWNTIGCACERFWPILLLGAILLAVGAYKGLDVLMLAGAFCFAVFCLMGLAFCAVPCDLELHFLRMPSGRAFYITFE